MPSMIGMWILACNFFVGDRTAKKAKFCTNYVYASLFLFMALGTHDLSFACDKRGHDCVVQKATANIRDLPFAVANLRGLFTKEGVYPMVLPSPSQARVQSLAEGNTLLVLAAPSEIVQIVQSEKRSRIISNLVASSPLFLSFREKELKTLKGKTIATGSSSQDAYVQFALGKAGFGKQDFMIKRLPDPQQRLALESSGDVAASVFDAGYALEAQKRGFSVIPLPEYLGYGIETALVGRTDLLQQELKGVTGILRALAEAIAWIYSPGNSAEVISVLEREYKMTKEAAAFFYETNIARYKIYTTDLSADKLSVKATNQWLSGAGIVIGEDFVDTSYLKQAGLLKR